MTLSERVRLGPACAVLGAMRVYTDRQMLTEVAPIGLLIWAGGVLAIGLIAMPWADAGEELRHLFSRCLTLLRKLSSSLGGVKADKSC